MHLTQITKIPVIKISLKLIYLLLLSGCLTPIDFSTESVGGTLVVSGQISNIPDQNIIQLGLTADSERLPVPLSGAYVLLVDDDNQSWVYSEDTFTPGMYTLPGFQGQPGKTYHIQLLTPNGKLFESEGETMPISSGQPTSHYEFLQEQYTDAEGIVSLEYFIKIYTNSQLPVSDVHLS
jgi:hypothetical protein